MEIGGPTWTRTRDQKIMSTQSRRALTGFPMVRPNLITDRAHPEPPMVGITERETKS